MPTDFEQIYTSLVTPSFFGCDVRAAAFGAKWAPIIAGRPQAGCSSRVSGQLVAENAQLAGWLVAYASFLVTPGRPIAHSNP
jgi:hypothetical protein